MDRKKSQKITLIFSAILMSVLIVIAVFVNRPQKSDHKEKARETTATEFTSSESNQTETSSTEEMTEAPKDTSDWEMQPAEDTTPDTGEKIQE